MKMLPYVVTILSAGLGHAEEKATYSISAVHAESEKILKDSGGKVPADLSASYQLLFERNTGYAKEDSPFINGMLVSKEPVLTPEDIVGFERIQGAAIVLHVKLDSDSKLKGFVESNPKTDLALVIDGSWVFYDVDHFEIRPDRGVIAFAVLTQDDEQKFLQLVAGKRGAAADEPLETSDPPPPPVPAPTYIGE